MADPPYSTEIQSADGAGRTLERRGSVVHLTPEEVASTATVVACLEREAARLPRSSTVAGIWRDWADLLRPTVAEQTQPTETPQS